MKSNVYSSLEEAFELSNFLELENIDTNLEDSEKVEEDGSFDTFSEFFL